MEPQAIARHYRPMSKRGFSVVPSNETKFVKAEVKRLAKELAERRRELGISQEVLAEKLDVSTTTIAYIEQGHRMPSIPMLVRMAKVLKLEIVLLQK